MKNAIAIFFFFFLSQLCYAQGLPINYLLRKAIDTSSQIEQRTSYADVIRILKNGDSFDTTYLKKASYQINCKAPSMALQLNYTDGLLTQYFFRYKGKLEHKFAFSYDHFSRLGRVIEYVPSVDTIYFDYDDSNRIYSVESITGGKMYFFYDSVGYLAALLRDTCAIEFYYDQLGNVVSENDPCNISKDARNFLQRINNYHRQSIDYRNTDSSSVYKLGRFLFRNNKKSVVVHLTENGVKKAIYSNTNVPSIITTYLTCPDCKSSKNYTPIRIDIGGNLDALGVLQLNNNNYARGFIKERLYLYNECYTRVLFLNYLDVKQSVSIFDSKLRFLGLSSFTNPVQLTNKQLLALHQLSYLNLDFKINAIKAPSRTVFYELNMGYCFDRSDIKLTRINYDIPYKVTSFYGEFACHFLNSKYFKLECSLRFQNQTNRNTPFTTSYTSNYIIPEVTLYSKKDEKHFVKLKSVNQVAGNSTGVSTYYSVQLGTSYIPDLGFLFVKKVQEEKVKYHNRLIKKSKWERKRKRIEKRKSKKNRTDILDRNH